eukprot:CAMPEP_0178392982 /NCGR_PEP_ID=MMETSP0689_2-20121128/11955_1 /TAXON_ID=160604 /ORGANISM="Amphidinium massartii, Strain CS-259" /LENGTH=73 /DNA_ID=CAMNT_0020013565 /DNA_START=434 /DNA_END=655 /DNA_ORIENTATION=-
MHSIGDPHNLPEPAEDPSPGSSGDVLLPAPPASESEPKCLSKSLNFSTMKAINDSADMTNWAVNDVAQFVLTS